MFVDTPSWCDDSLIATPPKPTVHDVDDEAVVLVGRLSVAAVALFLVDTVVRCLCFLAVGAETLKDDEAEVAVVAYRTDGAETLTVDDVEVVIVDCCPDGVEAFALDDVADR